MSNAPDPLIDVYIVHWRAPEWCEAAAASMLESIGVRVRCHVIDNGASGGSALSTALDPRVEIITTGENLGYSGAHNQGLARALAEHERADFLVLAAHDALVDSRALELMCAAARADARIGIVGPVLTDPAVEGGGWWRGWRARATSSWNEDAVFEDRDWLSGTLLFVRPECVEEIGGFDERLGSYVEDVDFCLRARDAGWRVGLATRARAAGIGSASADVTFMVDVNSVFVAAKRRGSLYSVRILCRYAYWIARGAIAAFDPRRTRDRRRASIAHARDHGRAVSYLVSHWSRVRDFARNPDDGVANFR
jgi:GT2 family glycosyltransferase